MYQHAVIAKRIIAEGLSVRYGCAHQQCYAHRALWKALQAHFIIKASQRKQELLYEAQALRAAIAQAERELAGLHQASEQIRMSNAELACSFRWGLPKTFISCPLP